MLKMTVQESLIQYASCRRDGEGRHITAHVFFNGNARNAGEHVGRHTRAPTATKSVHGEANPLLISWTT